MPRLKTSAVAIAIFGSLAVATAGGCRGAKEEKPEALPGAGPEAVPEVQISAAAREEAQAIFAKRCTPCHGPTGAGDGPTAKKLSPPPRDFRDPAWQQSVTDDHIEQIIRFGGAAVGKSLGMPPNPDLVEKPDVVAALREHVRGLGAPK